MRRRPRVQARLAELMVQNAKKSEMTRQEALQWLSAVIRTSPSEVTKSSSLCQAYEETPDGTIKLRMVDKVVALQQLARMCAWNSPEQLQIGAADSLKNYLMALRSQSFFGRLDSPPEQRAVSLIEIEGPAAPVRNGELGETS